MNQFLQHCARKQAWFAALNNTTTASDCQTPSGQIPRDQPKKEI